jgi:hypothetical protein
VYLALYVTQMTGDFSQAPFAGCRPALPVNNRVGERFRQAIGEGCELLE